MAKGRMTALHWALLVAGLVAYGADLVTLRILDGLTVVQAFGGLRLVEGNGLVTALGDSGWAEVIKATVALLVAASVLLLVRRGFPTLGLSVAAALLLAGMAGTGTNLLVLAALSPIAR